MENQINRKIREIALYLKSERAEMTLKIIVQSDNYARNFCT